MKSSWVALVFLYVSNMSAQAPMLTAHMATDEFTPRLIQGFEATITRNAAIMTLSVVFTKLKCLLRKYSPMPMHRMTAMSINADQRGMMSHLLGDGRQMPSSPWSLLSGMNRNESAHMATVSATASASPGLPRDFLFTPKSKTVRFICC